MGKYVIAFLFGDINFLM